MPATPAKTNLPVRVDSSMLAKYLQPNEPVIVLKLGGVGNQGAYDFRDKGTRSYIFRYEAALEGHVIRIPLHLWQENKGRMAHDIMDQRHLSQPLIVLVEYTPAEPIKKQGVSEASPASLSPEMGATDTSNCVQNVVGLDAEPTVAPAVEGQNSEPATGLSQAFNQQVHDLVEAPKRIKALAALLGVDEAALRVSIDNPVSTVEVTGPGWVKRKVQLQA